MTLHRIDPHTGAPTTEADRACEIAREAAEALQSELPINVTPADLFERLEHFADGHVDELLWRLACAELVTQRIAAYRADNGSGEPGHYCERGKCCAADRRVLDAMRCWLMPVREVAAVAAE
jgi:hypothetical protein